MTALELSYFWGVNATWITMVSQALNLNYDEMAKAGFTKIYKQWRDHITMERS